MNFKQVAAEIAEIVTKKSAAYGDSFGKSGSILKILYPNGVKVEEYDNFLAITRIVDKLFRIATDKDAFGESPWRDIVGYGLNAAAREPEPKAEAKFKVHVSNKRGQSQGWINLFYGDTCVFVYSAKTADEGILMSAADIERVVDTHGDNYIISSIQVPA